MKRRDFLRSTLAAGVASALPARVFAQVSPTASRDAQLFTIAERELARAGNGLWKRDIVGIADFGLHSAFERFHFVDLDNRRVQSFHVSHGTGSDWQHDGWLKRYSNVEGSEATSNGAYMTRSWYRGRYGTSIRLDGLDPSNSNALSRAIVMHPAEYARPEHIARWGKLGRSNGCFAMGPEQFDQALLHLAGGRLLYADTLGLAPDGSKMARFEPWPKPAPQPALQAKPQLLRPEAPASTFQQTNPGVF